MRLSIVCSLAFAVLFLSGCAASINRVIDGEQVSYYDRNHDGKVDLEKHHFVGSADADWELRDDDFDGRYEQKVFLGYVITRRAVDLPVPVGVHIEKP